MTRFLPSSLLGQVMISVALALLAAQIVAAVLLYRAGEERRETGTLTAAAFQLVTGQERAERRERREQGQSPSQRRGRSGARLIGRDARQDLADGPPLGFSSRGLPRSLRYTVSAKAPAILESVLASPTAEQTRETRLREVLLQEGIEPHLVGVTIARAVDDPEIRAFAQARPRFRNRQGWRERRVFIATMQHEMGGSWETARVIVPRPPAMGLWMLLLQTLVTFSILIVVLYLVLRRITRPLAQLTDRVDIFSRQPEQAAVLEETGPSDTRRLIAAHNAMEARIAALLDEKDVMLGAIGHDLKTPLAALRVRVESVADEAQRAKMAASIEDITATLDDILTLARIGRDGAEKETADLGALALGIAEEFEDMGHTVSIADPPRLVAQVHVTWIKRALRNLVSNAVRYAGSAEISMAEQDGRAVISIKDTGPGIAPQEIASMLEPFTRGEASRNRATGGAGLGLTLARAIAEQHGGKLVLENRETGGLRAQLYLPL